MASRGSHSHEVSPTRMDMHADELAAAGKFSPNGCSGTRKEMRHTAWIVIIRSAVPSASSFGAT
jgi:hypothetical protein